MSFSNADAADVCALVRVLADVSNESLRASIGRLISRQVLSGSRITKKQKQNTSGVNWSGVARLFPEECEAMYAWVQDKRGMFGKIDLIKQLRTFGAIKQMGLKDAKDIIESPHFEHYVGY